ncbi:hypothetical protein KC338_g1029 [Hortaea werneckii]|nr:hypothetical protein KC338_g1029 [Hortaea werneckii]
MPRSRVLSFMSQWGSAPKSPTKENAPPSPTVAKPPMNENAPPSAAARRKLDIDVITPQSNAQNPDSYRQNSPKEPGTPTRTQSRARGDSRAQRPDTMVQTYKPPQVEVANDTPPELQPIFSYLNSHSNKLYQEGYFLKLHDLDSRGRPSSDRVWTECFAQLVGTVLSLWDAAALDVAGEDGEVVPTFINLSDASLKMIESLPMNGAAGGSLQNVLSISTAANNRYLLHFNSLNSLTQWTAGIRLAMFEHSTLQEAYTGSLIAGKGKLLNNIKAIMERSKFVHEDWARVRFGAGTPWKRCWCVVSPPDEKEFGKAQKSLKKASAYERVKMPKGSIKFYDTRKVTKKTRPIATVSDAYAAYAIYPQSKPLIDQSTLVKLEGLVTVHGSPETTTEGFIFVMPEVHPAVSGFEMMLQFLFPVFDTFNLYGRPNKLIADSLDQRGLMFAMPRDRRWGYLDILDVSALIHTEGSQAWSERQWRREMKKLTSTRMQNQFDDSSANVRQFGQRRNTTTARPFSPAPERVSAIRFSEDASSSSPGSRSGSPAQQNDLQFGPPRRTDSAPPGAQGSPHKRSASDAQAYRKFMTETQSRLSYEATEPDNEEMAPPPPRHGGALGRPNGPGALPRIQSGAETPTLGSLDQDLRSQEVSSPNLMPPEPVQTPPAFSHNPGSAPPKRPFAAPELRRAHSNVDAATLYQMQDAMRPRDDASDEEVNAGGWNADVQQRQQYNVNPTNTLPNDKLGAPADRSQGALNDLMNDKLRSSRQITGMIRGSRDDGDFQKAQKPADHDYSSAALGTKASIRPEETLEQLQSDRSTSVTPLHSSRSIVRKPLPQKIDMSPIPTRSDSLPHEQATRGSEEQRPPESPVSNHSWADDFVDTDALDRMLLSSPDRNNTMQSQQSFASSATPDYASTVPSEPEHKQPVERPRAGKLKTVGDPDYQGTGTRPSSALRLDTWDKEQAEQSSEVPNVDFGPTFAYKPTSRPGTSGTITALDDGKARSRSADRLRQLSREQLSRISPAEGSRQSYFGGRNTPSPGALTPNETGNSPGNRNSVAWQPASRPSPETAPGTRQSLTPEQWVQYRANLASQPQQAPPRKPVPLYAHQRTASGSSVHQLRQSPAKTPPPLSRTPSGDWTQHAQRTPPSRPQSRGAGTVLNQSAPVSRPQSRGAGAYLNQQGQNGTLYSQHQSNLTAQEQMKVARATGTPLISYTSNQDKKSQEQYQTGLFGALAAREHEKAEMKKTGGNRNSMHVQHAIAQRQHQQQAAAAQAHAQAQAQYEMQMQQQQAAYHAQAQQMQAMQYNQMLLAQKQGQNPYGQQYQNSPMQAQSSWQQQPQYSTQHHQGWAGQGHQYGQGGQTPQQPARYGGSGGQWQQQQSRRG